MRDLNQLVEALREEADRLPPVSLLPGVRNRAGVIRRRLVVGASAVAVVVLATVAGVGYLALSPKSTGTGVAKPVTSAGALIGPTWYLTSWTTTAGKVQVPQTDRPPTLVFDSKTTAHSTDPTNTTTWSVRIKNGTLIAIEGDAATVKKDEWSQAVSDALVAATVGTATWHISGSTLVIGTGSGASVTYSSTEPTQTPGRLMGSTWYLESWTIAGKTDAPAGSSTPTLAFHDPRTAYTVGGNKTEWSVDLGAGTMQATEGDLPKTFADPADAAVEKAFTQVLSGSTSWQIASTRLVVRSAAGDSMTFGPDTQSLPPGTVKVTLLAKHAAGVHSTGQSAVAGEVDLVRLDGRASLGAGSSGVDIVVQGQPGRYKVTAKIKDGECTPTTVQVISGRTVQLTLSCQDGVSSD